MAATAVSEAKWPLADGGEYVISAQAVDWEALKDNRLDYCLSEEMDRLTRLDELRIVELGDMRECYLRALQKLAAEISKEIRDDDDQQIAEQYAT